jgi:TM2 domain-containing membrane protein YozV
MGKEEGPSRIVCALLALFLGNFGVHKFMLGNTMGGVIMLLTCGGCGWISLIEAIIYFMKTDEEFYQTYVVDKKAWF